MSASRSDRIRVRSLAAKLKAICDAGIASNREELGAKIGVSEKTISYYIHGDETREREQFQRPAFARLLTLLEVHWAGRYSIAECEKLFVGSYDALCDALGVGSVASWDQIVARAPSTMRLTIVQKEAIRGAVKRRGAASYPADWPRILMGRTFHASKRLPEPSSCCC